MFTRFENKQVPRKHQQQLAIKERTIYLRDKCIQVPPSWSSRRSRSASRPPNPWPTAAACARPPRVETSPPARPPPRRTSAPAPPPCPPGSGAGPRGRFPATHCKHSKTHTLNTEHTPPSWVHCSTFSICDYCPCPRRASVCCWSFWHPGVSSGGRAPWLQPSKLWWRCVN